MTFFRGSGEFAEADAAGSEIEVERGRFCPFELIDAVFAAVASRARAHDVSLEFDAVCALPETISSDRARLHQILTNLVSNAIRYTASGRVRVVARLASIRSQTQLSVDVVDDGVGIPFEAYEAIFDPSDGVERPGTHRFGGTAFGLPISRRFARLLGGDLFVRSVPGEGSTFTLRIDPGPLDGVSRVHSSEVRSIQSCVALRLLEKLEGLEASLQDGDQNAIDDLVDWLTEQDAAGSDAQAFSRTTEALSLLPRDAKEHEVVALIEELRSLAESIAAD